MISKINFLRVFFILALMFYSGISLKAQTCSSPKTYTVHNNGFSPVDSFYMQPYFLKFNAPENSIRTKILIKQLSTYPNYDIKLYRDSCANLPGNLLSPTLTIIGDTAIINFENYAIGSNYLIRMINQNISPPDTISKYSIAFLSALPSQSNIGVCPSSVTPVSCELVCNGSFEHLVSTIPSTSPFGLSGIANAYN